MSADGQPANGPLLAVGQLTKLFGTFAACNGIDLDIKPGEIHALLGENGAGKSTLVKMLFGVLAPTSGEIVWQGQPVRIASPSAARKLGIGMVFQHFSLFEALTVAENIALSMAPGISLDTVLPRKRPRCRTAYGLPLDPKAHVADLSVGERQRIEIVRASAAEPEADHSRRADFGADAAGSRPTVRDVEQAEGRRSIGPLYQSSAGGGAAHLRPCNGAAARQGHRRLRPAPGNARLRWRA